VKISGFVPVETRVEPVEFEDRNNILHQSTKTNKIETSVIPIPIIKCQGRFPG